jgi:hypothetical protein
MMNCFKRFEPSKNPDSSRDFSSLAEVIETEADLRSSVKDS